jgi:hypothetical protein
VKVGAKEAEFAELGDQVKRESGFAVVLFDDGQNFVVDKLAGGLADQFFFVVKLGIKIDEIDTGKRGHAKVLRVARCAGKEV